MGEIIDQGKKRFCPLKLLRGIIPSVIPSPHLLKPSGRETSNDLFILHG